MLRLCIAFGVLSVSMGCAQTSTTVDANKEAAQQAGGKGDQGADLCELFGWYGDGVCDDWCPEPDALDCGGDECPNPDDAGVRYVGDAEQCKVIRFACEDNETHFSNECGCGCVADEEPADACEAQDAAGQGACRAIIGYVWNGQVCEIQSGCECVGSDCAEVFADEKTCEASYASCGSASGCCDPATYPDDAFEGAHCCGDGSWAYDNGNGKYDNECENNGNEGQICEAPSVCCDPDAYPENAREGAHCCGDGSWAYDNGNGKYDNECENNGNEGQVCESKCLDPNREDVEYVGDADFCTRAYFVCDDDEQAFWNDCGCGCVKA